MYRHLLFTRPSSKKLNKILSEFTLTEVLFNERTHIFENDEISFSIDKKVVRVFLYNGENYDLIKKVKDLFYGKTADRRIHRKHIFEIKN